MTPHTSRSTPRSAALHYADVLGWPLVPAAALTGSGRAARCGCGDADCVVPGAHPGEPILLAATREARMVDFWWRSRPEAGVVLATGGVAPCGLSLPADAAAGALERLERVGVTPGPVLASPTRWTFLVAPYALPQLGELLHQGGPVPTSLRFHGEGGYVALPPTRTPLGPVRWVRAPRAGTPGRAAELPVAELPSAAWLLPELVTSGTEAPDQGSTLSY